jgi:hypothetical protein
MSPAAYMFWADVVLALHMAYTAFIVLGLMAIWVGRLFRARFVANPWFRWTHLACMGVVVVQSILGIMCPLTVLEWRLREASGLIFYRETFMQRVAEVVLYEDLPGHVFLVIYIAFFMAMLLTAVFVPFGRKNT